MSERREGEPRDEPEQQTDPGEGSTANTAADIAAGRERDEAPPEGDEQAEDKPTD